MNLLRWLSPAPTTHPILLRLHLGGAPCPSTVEVEAEWLPRGERARERLLSASSMVLLPWRRDAEGASLSIRAAGRSARTTLTRESSDGVIDVHLVP